MRLLSIDPGNKRSGMVIWDGQRVCSSGTYPNDKLLQSVNSTLRADRAVIEQVKNYGIAVGDPVLDTVFWTGRFYQALSARGIRADRMPRKTVKMHLCGKVGGVKDANVNCELRNRYGPKPTKGRPSAVYGKHRLKGDEWAAFALAVTYWDTIIMGNKCGWGTRETI